MADPSKCDVVIWCYDEDNMNYSVNGMVRYRTSMDDPTIYYCCMKCLPNARFECKCNSCDVYYRSKEYLSNKNGQIVCTYCL